MNKPFSYEEAAGPVPQSGSFSYDEAVSSPDSGSNPLRRLVADPAISLLKGAIAVPESAVGLADMVTGGRAGKAAEDYAGFRPKDAKNALNELYSPEQKAANASVQEADGFIDTMRSIGQSPSVIPHAVLESLPVMGAGGVASKALPFGSAVMRGAIGEGLAGAGSAAEQSRQESEDGLITPKQSALAAASGLGATAFGAAGGKLSSRLGIGDIETMMAGGAQAVGKKGMLKSAAQGALSEGVLEEMPQSVWEQGVQNAAAEQPLGQGLGQAAAMGVVTGGVMGAAGGAYGSLYARSKQEKKDTATAPEIAGLLPAPVNTGTPSENVLLADVERQNAVDAAQRNADQVYAERAAYEAAMASLYPAGAPKITADIVPLQQQIDEMLGVDQTALKGLQRVQYQKALEKAFNEPVGITHDQNGHEIPLTMGQLLDSQVTAEQMARNAVSVRHAREQALAKSSQVADEETQTQPDIPVIGPLSAVASHAVKSGLSAQVQKAAEQATSDGGESNGGESGQKSHAGVAAQGAQAARADLPGSGNVLAPASAGDSGAGGGRAEVDGSGMRPVVPAGTVGEGGLNQADTIRPYKEGQARMMAARLSRQGLPSEHYPHPTQSGMFAIRSVDPSQQAVPMAGNVAPSAPDVAENNFGNTAPAPRAQAPNMRRDDLVGAIMRATGGRGISAGMAQTLTGDTANKVPKLRGLFTNQGQQDMDDLAMLLREQEGFDVRDAAHLEDLIREAAGGNVAVSMERQERDAAAAQEKQYRDSIHQKAKKYGVKTVAVKFSALEKIVLARMEERHNQAVARLDDRSRSRFETALADAMAAIPDDVVDETMAEVSRRGLHARGFWNEATRILRGMVYDAKQEAANGTEAGREEAGDGRGNSGVGRGTPADQRDQAPASAAEPAAEPAREEQRPGLDLQGQTRADIRDQEAQRQAEEARANRPEPDNTPKVKADQVELFNTQGGLFNSNRDVPQNTPKKVAPTPDNAATRLPGVPESGMQERPAVRADESGLLEEPAQSGNGAGSVLDSSGFDAFVNQFREAQPVDAYNYERKLNDLIEEIESDWSNGNSDDYSGRFGPDTIYSRLHAENEAKYFDSDGDLTDEGSQRFNAIEREMSTGIARDELGDPERESIDLIRPKDMAKVLHAYLDKSGVDVGAISGSGKSQSQYFEVVGKRWRSKVRVADHALPVEHADREPADYEVPLYDQGDDLRGDGRISSESIEEIEAINRAKAFIDALSEDINTHADLPRVDTVSAPVASTEQAQPSRGVDEAAHEAATSPQNDLPEPSQAQKESGNYKVGRVKIAGLDISIENPEGSTRSGTDPNGNPWSITMQSHYGYIRKTEGRDGDHVDVFVKPGTVEDYGGNVFVIDQRKGNGQFDEHKVMLGWTNEEDAKAAYLANYSKGWTGLGAISPMTMDELKAWVESGDQKQPIAPKTLPEAIAEQADTIEPAKVEDFGEKIGGSRKDKSALREMLQDRSDDEIATLPFSKTWPVEEVDKIEDVFSAAVAYAARSEIPTKPRTAYKLKRWVATVKAARQMLSDFFGRFELSRDKFLEQTGDSASLRMKFIPKVLLLEQIDRSQWKRIEEVSEYPDAIRYSDNAEKIPSPFVAVRIDGKSHSFYGAKSIADVVEKVNALLGNEAQVKRMQFEVRGRGGLFSINKKGDGEYRKLKTFTTSKEALDFVKSGYAELVSEWENVKARDNVKETDVRNDENRLRTAKDWRNGKDISTEAFQEKFGFRGGEFGSWVSQGSGAKARQWMLNEAHDALMDLSDILGIPPKAVSLNGSLGIAFGARGSGNASAHYEPDSIVINLTKTKGAGTLAHEWFHALDNYFSRRRGGEVKFSGDNTDYRRNNYITYKPEPMFVHKTQRSTPTSRTRLDQLRAQNPSAEYLKPENWQLDPKHKEGVRPEVERAFSELVEALDASPMTGRSRMNDKGADGYWSRIIERGARSFENYVIHKMALNGHHNDYLANVRSAEDFPRNKERYPYLLENEMQPVVEAFDDLFSKIESGETDKGVALFNKSGNGKISTSDKAVYGMVSEGKSAAEVLGFIAKTSRNPFYRQLAKLLTKTGIAPELTLDAPSGWTFAAGQDNKYAAAYNPKTNVVALFRPASAERNTLHELVHAATLKALSKNGLAAAQMNALFKHVKASGKLHGQYGMANVEEFVAEAFSNPKFQQALKQIKASSASTLKGAWHWFVRIVRGILGIQQGQENALSQALEIGVELIRENMRVTAEVEGTRYATGPKQTDSEAFRKWFGGSKVVDENGQPLVVYHGTNADFSEFDTSKTKPVDGVFLTPTPRSASTYASTNKDGSSRDGANVMPVYASLQNPRIIDVSKGDYYNLTSLDAAMSDGKSDGVIVIGEDGNVHVVVAKRSNQVKSAIGNNGDFSPSNPDIRYNIADDGAWSVSEPSKMDTGKIVGDSGRSYDQRQRAFFKNVGRELTPKGMVERTREYLQNDFWKKMAVGIVDQFRGLRDLGDNGQAYMLARLSKGTAGAFETLLHHGKLSIKDGAYDGDRSGGFIEKLGSPLHGELDDFLWYVAANRAEGLSQQERENLFTPADIAAGKSLAGGSTSFDYNLQTGPSKGKTTRNRAAIYADALRVFNEFQKNTLDIAEQSGLIDGASRKFWEREFYVPFYRVSEEDGEFIGAKMGKALVRQQAFKKLKGGTDKLNSDLLSNTLLNWSHLIEASAKNRAAKASLSAAENIGVAQRVAPDMESYAAANGAMLPPGTKKTVWFQENGKKVEYLVSDPFVMTAITSLEYAGMRNGVMDAMSKFKHWLTIGVTASPAFKVRNLIRDSLQAIGTSELGYNPIKNVTEGFKQTQRDSQEYVSALASGGLIRFGTMMEGSESSRVRQLIKSGVKDSSILDSEPKWRQFYDKYLEPGISAYNEIGNRSEEINRAALYNQLIKQGKSHAEAALLARDLMDFSMQGSFNTIRFLTQVTPFLNARLQGMYKLGRSAKDNPRKMAVVTGAVALASIALMLGYEDDEDWKRREDWDRDGFWWFRFGGIEYRIPKPFEIGAVASLAERSVEYLTNDEMTGDRFLRVLGSLAENNLSMNPVPQAVKPIIDLYANKDSFTKRPIETMGMQRLDPTMRFNSNTSMVARGLSNATMGVLSPVQYDHLARAYFGWLGAFVVGGADMAYRAVSDEPTQPALDYFKFATQGILKEQGTGSSRYVSMVYDQAKELEETYSTYRQLIKDQKIGEVKEYAEDHADQLRRYRSVEAVKQTEAKMNQNIREIERSDISADEKKVRIGRIQKMKERVAMRIAPGLQGP